ncbi:MAG: undecaprenyl-phosphate glucose phosphotransferase [Steroidobacteraceae bacterium]|nr:undecaprenyl-phosphate glucose phosphotransferase [Steroidobacteraceae bacterium]
MSVQVHVADRKPFASAAPGQRLGWVHSNGALLIHTFRLADAACLVLGLRLASEVLHLPWAREQVLLALLAVAYFMLVASPVMLYRSWRASSIVAELNRVLFCCVATIALIALSVIMTAPVPSMALELLAYWCALSFAIIAIGRIAIRQSLRTWRASGRNYRTAVIVGAGEIAQQLAQHLEDRPWMGIQLLATAGVGDFERLKLERPVDIVYIALPLRMHRHIQRIVHGLRDSTASVYFVPDFSAYGLLHSTWDGLGDMLTVSLVETPHQGLDGAMKRVVDVVVATVALLGLAVPLLAIAAAVRLTSPGPVIFTQKRYGLDGKSFRIYKFRTMTQVEDGESQLTFTQASRRDARVTPVGAFLRRTSLDELPQLFNVLKGDMSIVGPRPHPVALNETQRKVIDGYMLRHKVKPGITGLAQVNGFRGETDTPEKMRQRVRFDLEYINAWSLLLDIRIMWRTLFVVFHDPNAY